MTSEMVVAGVPPIIFGRVLLSTEGTGGTARPHPLTISGARKSVVAVTGKGMRLAQCPLLLLMVEGSNPRHEAKSAETTVNKAQLRFLDALSEARKSNKIRQNPGIAGVKSRNNSRSVRDPSSPTVGR